MSVAAPTQMETKGVSSQANLWTTGLMGGVYVLAATAIVFYGVPQLWEMSVGAWLGGVNGFANAFFRVLVQAVAASLLAVFGVSLAGPNPPKGIRGSIFLGISIVFTVFFLARAVLNIVERMMRNFNPGQVVALVFVGTLVYFFYKFLVSDRFTRWSAGLESAGWFDVAAYKRNQGQRVRRLTTLGLLLLFGSGIYTMVLNRVIGVSDLVVNFPFANASFDVVPNAPIVIPVVLGLLALWFAWRIVNYPIFADFLIATEAEMNKVSWTPRARLVQDTIVVLVTVAIITVFLFIADYFWATSLGQIGIIPSGSETPLGQENAPKPGNPNEY